MCFFCANNPTTNPPFSAIVHEVCSIDSDVLWGLPGAHPFIRGSNPGEAQGWVRFAIKKMTKGRWRSIRKLFISLAINRVEGWQTLRLKHLWNTFSSTRIGHFLVEILEGSLTVLIFLSGDETRIWQGEVLVYVVSQAETQDVDSLAWSPVSFSFMPHHAFCCPCESSYSSHIPVTSSFTVTCKEAKAKLGKWNARHCS